MSGTIYNLLLPREKTGTQEFWNQHIAILRSAVEGVPYHLATLDALLSERLYFFRNDPSRNNGLLLVQMSATSWQIVRTMANIIGDEQQWFRAQVSNPDSLVWAELGVTSFFDQMHEVFEIASFLRHPKDKLMTYDWVFHGTWPQDKAEFIVQAANALRSIMNLAINDFGLETGWVGDATKKTLHDSAMKLWTATTNSGVQ